MPDADTSRAGFYFTHSKPPYGIIKKGYMEDKTDKTDKQAEKQTECIIYCRFSPRKNAENCVSCEVQRAYCEQFAAQRKWHIKAIFMDNGVSGTAGIECRNLHIAINELKKGDILLAHKRDRFARDLMIGLQIERVVEAKRASVAVAEGEPYGNDPNAKLMKHMLMCVSEWERQIISDRTRLSMRQQQAAGKRVSKVPPYGFMLDPNNPDRLVENPAEQPTLNLIAELYRKGMAINRIAKTLDPATSRTGKPWATSTVHHIIHYRIDPIYKPGPM